MAHFAELDKENKVIRVILVSNENAPDEKTGIKYIKSLNIGGNWIQTSYNNNIRGKFAGIGDIYNSEQDVFYTPIIEPEIEESFKEKLLEDETLAE